MTLFKRRLFLIVVCFSLILTSWLASFFCRIPDFNIETGAPNLEASYHALLTIRSMRESPVREHYFLPTVSLGADSDKGIPWGATIPLKSGHYVYTSFPSSGFVIPYLFFRITGVEPSIRSLAIFNSLLGLVSVLLCFGFGVFTLRALKGDCGRSIFAMSAILASAIWTPEFLQSFGIVYWSHSISQIFFLCAVICAVPYVLGKELFSANILSLFFVYLWCVTEWSGFVYSAGLCFIYLLNYVNKRDVRELHRFMLVCGVTLFAGITLVVHYGSVAGYLSTFNAFWARFFARSYSQSTLSQLIIGYADSFGLFFLIPPFLLLSARLLKCNSKGSSANIALMLLIVVLFPLLENLVMLQHAVQFSFDRLKAIPVLLLFSVFIIGRMQRLPILYLSGIVVLSFVSAAHGWQNYRAKIDNQTRIWGGG